VLSIDLTDYLTEQNQGFVQKWVRFILPVFSLSLKHLRASQANSSSQAGRATLFPPFFSRDQKHAPKGRPQHVFIDSRNVSHITDPVGCILVSLFSHDPNLSLPDPAGHIWVDLFNHDPNCTLSLAPAGHIYNNLFHHDSNYVLPGIS
jgi:hypothetical protein